MLDDLFSLSQTFIRNRNRDFKRYFLREHSLGNRFSIIVGQRGIGKTTALIQYLLGKYGNDLFSNMLSGGHSVSAQPKGDFLVNDCITFEVGG